MRTFQCLACGKEKKWGWSTTNTYCSNKCQKEYETKQRISDWLSGKISGSKSTGAAGWIKSYILEKQGYACSECGITEWNNKPIVLECDHIDGDSTNNIESNLRCICPNCHSQSDTYKNKNKGNSRSYRMKRYHEGKSW